MGWWGLLSHFRVQPNYSIEVVLWLCCFWGCDKNVSIWNLVSAVHPYFFFSPCWKVRIINNFIQTRASCQWFKDSGFAALIGVTFYWIPHLHSGNIAIQHLVALGLKPIYKFTVVVALSYYQVPNSTTIQPGRKIKQVFNKEFKSQKGKILNKIFKKASKSAKSAFYK